MKLSQVIEKFGIDWDKIMIEPESSTFLNTNYVPDPKAFLEFAKLDIQSNLNRGYVNALSNTKRAIDCQIDQLFESLGLKTKNNNFPTKIEQY